MSKYIGGTTCILGRECVSGGCPWAVAGETAPEEEAITDTGQDTKGNGGFCCAAGLGSCNGFGLCDSDSGACHGDECHKGLACETWVMAPWLVQILLLYGITFGVVNVFWSGKLLKWYIVIHAKPAAPAAATSTGAASEADA